MLEDSSDSIENVKEIGAEEKERKKHELVMMILTIVFSVIPLAGQVVASLGGVARIAMGALIIGEAGNAVLSITEIIKNPESAPFAVLGMLLGAAGMAAQGPRKAFHQAAQARRALSPESLKSFSPKFRDKDAIFQRMIRKCMV